MYMKAMYVSQTGTSPVLWNDLKNGAHTVTVKSSCNIEGNQFSNEDMKIQFQID